MRWLLATLGLTLVYALTLASFDPWDLAMGALFSVGTLLLVREFVFQGPALGAREVVRRLLGLPRLVLATLRDITAGTWAVALVVVGARPLERPGIVVVPLEDRTEFGAVVSAYLITLSPGEFLVDLDPERREMLVHVLDARDADAVRRRFADFYRRYQSQAAP